MICFQPSRPLIFLVARSTVVWWKAYPVCVQILAPLFASQETLSISLDLSDLNFLNYKMRMILSVVNLLRSLRIVAVESLPKYLFHILVDKEIMAIVVVINIITYFFSLQLPLFSSTWTQRSKTRDLEQGWDQDVDEAKLKV